MGVGTHTFKYPDIQIEVSGKVSVGNTSIIPDYYKASVEVEVIGGLKNIFIKDGGVGYGVTNIINYERRPKISLLRVPPFLGVVLKISPLPNVLSLKNF